MGLLILYGSFLYCMGPFLYCKGPFDKGPFGLLIL